MGEGHLHSTYAIGLAHPSLLMNWILINAKNTITLYEKSNISQYSSIMKISVQPLYESNVACLFSRAEMHDYSNENRDIYQTVQQIITVATDRNNMNQMPSDWSLWL